MKYPLAIALFCAIILAGCGSGKNEEINAERIWDKDYSAFPSIVRYNDAWYVSFREGVSHIFDENGIAAGKKPASCAPMTASIGIAWRFCRKRGMTCATPNSPSQQTAG